MSLFDNQKLPGVLTEIISDYDFGYDTSKFGTTSSVAIIGTAFNGPVGKPVEIYSPEHAKYVFGEVFDYKSKKEATLVAEILDAWNRGCRTIYAIRVSGKDIQKDFQFAINTDLRLRVSGLYPSNLNKDIFMTYDNTPGNSSISFYKPAKRATIREKSEGLIENEEDTLMYSIYLERDYALTANDSLIDLLKVINEHIYNNVLRLSIVDKFGNEVTYTSKEAQGLAIGSLFPGAYFIGRDKSFCNPITEYNYQVINESNKPFDSFKGQLFKKITINTDVTKDLPIYGRMPELNSKFEQAGVRMASMWDFLKVTGRVDSLYGKDSIDYEEVEMTDFDLYSKLGSGFVLTSKIDKDKKNKIVPTSMGDPNRIVPVKDGIYSMMENLKADYRVLTIGSADQKIADKKLFAEDFKVTAAEEMETFKNTIIAKKVINKDDKTEALTYQFKVKAGNDYEDFVIDALYTDKIIESIATITSENDLKDLDGRVKNFENGSLFFNTTDNSLLRVDDKTISNITAKDLVGKVILADNKLFLAEASLDAFTEILTASELTDKKYILVDTNKSISVFEIKGSDFVAVGNLSELLEDKDDKVLVSYQNGSFNGTNANKIVTIQTDVLDFTTLSEMVNILNSHSEFNGLFEFSIHPDYIINKDDYLLELTETGLVASTSLISKYEESNIVKDRTRNYDYGIYIPNKVTDNFARQLAQHCTYTSFKTAPTHGIIGCSKQVNVNLNAVAAKVEDLLEVNFDLYAKKDNGNSMLDANNLPYPIGRNISIVAGQYLVDSGDGYNYISNGASGYAGMVSALPLDQSSTSQPINISSLMYEYTNYQLERLTQKGFITFKQSYSMGYVVTDGITMAPSTSPFARLSVSRIISNVEEMIRAAGEPFIGKQNNLTNRNSLQTAIKSSLERIKGTLIEAYDFNLVLDNSLLKLGVVKINYRIVPIYEIREVRNVIELKESL